MEENGLSMLGSHLLLNRSNFERETILKEKQFWSSLAFEMVWEDKHWGGGRKLLLFRDVLV